MSTIAKASAVCLATASFLKWQGITSVSSKSGSTTTEGALAWVDAGGGGRRVGPEGVLGLGKVGGGVDGVCGFFTAFGIRSGPEGTWPHQISHLCETWHVDFLK